MREVTFSYDVHAEALAPGCGFSIRPYVYVAGDMVAARAVVAIYFRRHMSDGVSVAGLSYTGVALDSISVEAPPEGSLVPALKLGVGQAGRRAEEAIAEMRRIADLVLEVMEVGEALKEVKEVKEDVREAT